MRILVWVVAMITAAGVLQVSTQPAAHIDTPTLGLHGENDGNHGVLISGRGIELTHMQLMRGAKGRAPITASRQDRRADGDTLRGRDFGVLNLTGGQSFGGDVMQPEIPTPSKPQILFRF